MDRVRPSTVGWYDLHNTCDVDACEAGRIGLNSPAAKDGIARACACGPLVRQGPSMSKGSTAPCQRHGIQAQCLWPPSSGKFETSGTQMAFHAAICSADAASAPAYFCSAPRA